MPSPVNTIKIKPITLKSKIRSYEILIDRKTVQDHFQDALAIVEGRNLSWASKKDVVVDGLQLLASGKASGPYAIFNCTCGSGAECVDLEFTVEVTHESDLIIWTYRAPRYGKERSEKIFTFKFHKPQYLKALENVEEVNNLKGLPGYGVV